MVALQLGHLGGQRVGWGGFSAAPGRGQCLEEAGGALAAPVGQRRGIEALAPQDGTDPPGVGGAIGLGQDPQLVCGFEAAAMGAVAQFSGCCGGCRHHLRPMAFGAAAPAATSSRVGSMGLDEVVLPCPQV